MFKNLNRKGYNLMELIVVIIIIGVLIAMAVPKYLDHKKQADLAVIQNDSKVVQNTLLLDVMNNYDNESDFFKKDKEIIKVNIKEEFLKNNSIFKNGEPIKKENIGGNIYRITEEYIGNKVKFNNSNKFYLDDKFNIYCIANNDDFKKEDQDNNELKSEKYRGFVDKENIIITGFNPNYKGKRELSDIVELEKNGLKITKIADNAFKDEEIKNETFPLMQNLEIIGDNAFRNVVFIGNFPNLKNLKRIENGAFTKSKFEGAFPYLENLEYIGWNSMQNSVFKESFHEFKNLEYIGALAFKNSKFTEEFPALLNIKTIGNNAFEDSNFTKQFPKLKNIKTIGRFAFKNSFFEGEFPLLNNIEKIDISAFLLSSFSSNFPQLNNIKLIGDSAFYNSNFNKDSLLFYFQWDGKKEWNSGEESIVNRKILELNTENTSNIKINKIKKEINKINNDENIEQLNIALNNIINKNDAELAKLVNKNIDVDNFSYAQSLINKVYNDKEREKLQHKLNLKYSLKTNENLAKTSNVKHWGRNTTIKQENDYFVVNGSKSIGGFGLVTDRDIGINYKKGQKYIIMFDVKTPNINKLSYNYIISDSGNTRLNNISIKEKNKWERVSLEFASYDKERINAGFLIGGDVRVEKEGVEFLVKNIKIKEITNYKDIYYKQ